MFLGHSIYQRLHDLVGPEATTILAEHFNGETIFLPPTKGITRLIYLLLHDHQAASHPITTNTQQIKILLLEKGITQGDLARELHVTPSLISGLISNRFKSRRLQEAIAQRLGVEADTLWKPEHSKAT